MKGWADRLCGLLGCQQWQCQISILDLSPRNKMVVLFSELPALLLLGSHEHAASFSGEETPSVSEPRGSSVGPMRGPRQSGMLMRGCRSRSKNFSRCRSFPMGAAPCYKTGALPASACCKGCWWCRQTQAPPQFPGRRDKTSLVRRRLSRQKGRRGVTFSSISVAWRVTPLTPIFRVFPWDG